MSEPKPATPAGGPSAADRPARLVGLYSARPLALAEVPKLVAFCAQAYAEDTPGASMRLLDAPEGANVFRLEVVPGMLLKECEIVLRVHAIDDPQSDAGALVAHFGKLDPEIGSIASEMVQGAQSYLAIIGTRLAEQGRIRSFLNVVALLGSAMGAAFLDPAAVMATTDPGEWVEACEQSLAIEGAMAAARGS